MKVLIVSDTHGRDDRLCAVIKKEQPFDMFCHLGDSEGSEVYFRQWIPNEFCEIHTVRGNNDFFSRTPIEKEVEIGEYRILLTHGNRYGVSSGTQRLLEEAKKRGIDMVFYGHTHRPCLKNDGNGILMVNPGSLSYPRQNGKCPSYAVLWLNESKEVHAEIYWMNEDE